MTLNRKQLFGSIVVISLFVTAAVVVVNSRFYSDDAERIGKLEKKVSELAALQKSGGSTASPSTDSEKKIEQQLALMQQQMAEIRAALVIQRNDGGDEVISDEAGIAKESPQETIALEEEKALKRDAAIEASFLAEEYDEIWSSDVTSKIEQNFNLPALSSARLISADCRTTVCLIEFELSPEDDGTLDHMAENEFLAALSEELPSGTIKSVPDGQGGLRYTIYMAKSGHHLPGLDKEN